MGCHTAQQLMSMSLFINWPDIYCTAFILCTSFLSTQHPFFTPLSWNSPSWRICGRLIKNFWGTSGVGVDGGGFKSSNRVGVGKCYGSPPTALRSSQNTLIFVFHLKPGWWSNERALLHRWAHRYESIQTACMCVCVCVRKHEKSAIPFANIDMGVPIQSCYKDYCLLRSHFIRLKHTPQGAHWGCCRGPSLLASLQGWLGGGVL